MLRDELADPRAGQPWLVAQQSVDLLPEGTSLDGRGGRRYRRASAERNARRIVLRPWPVRRTISLIDNRFTKYKRRISAHCSTPTTTSSSLDT